MPKRANGRAIAIICLSNSPLKAGKILIFHLKTTKPPAYKKLASEAITITAISQRKPKPANNTHAPRQSASDWYTTTETLSYFKLWNPRLTPKNVSVNESKIIATEDKYTKSLVSCG